MKGTYFEQSVYYWLTSFCCCFSMTRNILSGEDKAVEHAKWGLGIAAVVGMLITSFIY